MSSNWVNLTLAEVADTNPRPEKGKYADDLEVSFVPMRLMQKDGTFEAAESRTFGELKKGYTFFAENDVLFAKITPCMENGKIGVARRLVNGIGFGTTEFHVVRAGEKVTPRFLLHFLRQGRVLNAAAANMKGTAGQKRLPIGWLRALPISVPPLAEQKRIVAKIDELFSDIDAGNAALVASKRDVAACHQATLNALVLGTLDNPDCARVLRDGKPVLPEGWRWTTLGEVSEVVKYGTGDKAQSEETSIPVLRILNVKQGQIVAADLKYMPESWADLDKYRLCKGDLLFIRTNGSRDLVGTAAMYAGHPENAVCASYLITVRLDACLAMPEFVLHCLNSAFGRGYIASVVSQVGQANVNGTKLKAFPIPLPPLSEQARLSAQADEMLSQLEALQADVMLAARQSDQLRQSVLAAAFSGQLI